MCNLRKLTSTVILITLFALLSTEALAKRPSSNDGTTDSSTSCTLSQRNIGILSRTYLDDFQAVDPSITYQDLSTFLCGLNTTSTAVAKAALREWLASLDTTNTTVNQSPVISGTPDLSVDEGQHYVFSPSANDPDGDALSFSIANKPAWASFDSASGTLSGTPDYGMSGSYANIEISVNDGALTSTLPAFTLNVNDVAQTPVEPDPVAGPPTLVSVGVSGDNIQIAWVQDNAVPDGGYDTFIDGVDTNTQYRTTSTSLSVGGLDLTLSHCFQVEARYTATGEFYPSNQLCSEPLAAPNQAPVISGTPSTVIAAGASYRFQPTSSDPDGDALNFSVINLPAWASFDNQTGALYGTPGISDAGSYTGIEIRVSDGQALVSLSPFDLTVEAEVATTSTTLNWSAPSTRADGTPLPLSEIDGYRIYMGASETDLVPVMDINDGSVNRYTLDSLGAGIHYFSVTAYDMDGNESAHSNVIMRSSL